MMRSIDVRSIGGHFLTVGQLATKDVIDAQAHPRPGNYTTTDGTLSKINGAAFQDFNVSGGLAVKFGGGSDLVVFDQLAPPTFTNVNIDLAAPPIVATQMAEGQDGWRHHQCVQRAGQGQPDHVGRNITGNLTVNTGADNDWVFVANTPIGGNVSINTGAGADTAELKNMTGTIGGSVDIQLYSSLAEKDADCRMAGKCGRLRQYQRPRRRRGRPVAPRQRRRRTRTSTWTRALATTRWTPTMSCAVDNFFAKLGDGNDIADINDLYVIHGKTQIDAGNGSDSLTKTGAFPTSQVTQTGFEWINGRPVFLATFAQPIGNDCARL